MKRGPKRALALVLAVALLCAMTGALAEAQGSKELLSAFGAEEAPAKSLAMESSAGRDFSMMYFTNHGQSINTGWTSTAGQLRLWVYVSDASYAQKSGWTTGRSKDRTTRKSEGRKRSKRLDSMKRVEV